VKLFHPEYDFTFHLIDDMEIPKVKELSSRLIHEVGTNRFVLRHIEVGEFTPRRFKFGISRLWYSETQNSWLPAKKSHVYLPIQALPNFKRTLDQFVTQFVAEQANESHGDVSDCSHDDSDDNNNNDKGPSRGSTGTNGAHYVSETVERPVVATCATKAAPKSDVAVKRKRGRPCTRDRPQGENAPRFNVHFDAESGSDTAEHEKNMRIERGAQAEAATA
jgi:hypothetical protein